MLFPSCQPVISLLLIGGFASGWTALAECVNPDGKLTHVQPVGGDSKGFAPDSSDGFGVGAFLLAGSEVYQLVRN
jgi:hypothetical protein